MTLNGLKPKTSAIFSRVDALIATLVKHFWKRLSWLQTRNCYSYEITCNKTIKLNIEFKTANTDVIKNKINEMIPQKLQSWQTDLGWSGSWFLAVERNQENVRSQNFMQSLSKQYFTPHNAKRCILKTRWKWLTRACKAVAFIAEFTRASNGTGIDTANAISAAATVVYRTHVHLWMNNNHRSVQKKQYNAT